MPCISRVSLNFGYCKNSGCSIHEEEAGILSLGTLYLISVNIPVLQTLSQILCVYFFLNPDHWKQTNALWERINTFPIFCGFYLHLSPFIHAKATAHSEWAISSSAAVTALAVQKYCKPHLHQETGVLHKQPGQKGNPNHNGEIINSHRFAELLDQDLDKICSWLLWILLLAFQEDRTKGW